VFWLAFGVNSTVSVNKVVAVYYVEVKVHPRTGHEDPEGE
jgi:hypothetical protein